MYANSHALSLFWQRRLDQVRKMAAESDDPKLKRALLLNITELENKIAALETDPVTSGAASAAENPR